MKFSYIFFMNVTESEKRDESFQINGFTLGELLVVILIISVLISIVIPVFLINLRKAEKQLI